MISGIIGNEKHTSTTRKAITEEALILEGGGTDSTAQALEAATFYILNDPKVSFRLREELIQAIPDPNVMPPLPKLREIKYLVIRKITYLPMTVLISSLDCRHQRNSPRLLSS
jgi:cytochrome P450